MIELLESELEIIQNHALNDALQSFRSAFISKHGNDIEGYINNGATPQPSETDKKDTVFDLISALQVQPAARFLWSRASAGELRDDIVTLFRLASDQARQKLVNPLLKLVLTEESDADIWTAVFRLIAQTTKTPLHVLHTSSSLSSSSQFAWERRREEIDQRIHEELRDCVYVDVEGFFDRYFENHSWSSAAAEIYERSKERYEDDRWVGWPSPPAQDGVLEWLQSFQDSFLGELDRTYYTSDRHRLIGSERDCKLDHFLAPSKIVVSSGKYDWSNVLVVGELKENPKEDGCLETLVQLAGYARELFAAQPSRRFTHAYTLCGSQMRLYLFDRSGAYSCPKFDIHKHPERFVKALAGYALMSNEDLGLNTFIKCDNLGSYIVSHEAKIYLQEMPIAAHNRLVCRGTTCYRGKKKGSKNWDYIVKFSWPSTQRRREGNLLKLAQERGVKGIAQWVDHQDIVIAGRQDTIANLRSGFAFTKPRQESGRSASEDGASSESMRSRSKPAVRASKKLENSASLTRGLGLSSSSSSVASASSSRKRKREQENAGSSQSKKGGSSDATSEEWQSQDKVAKEDDVKFEKTPYTKLQEPQPDSLMAHEDKAYDDRAHCCLVVSPVGRPIHDFSSLEEFLVVLRDAIHAHKSLWIDGRILHRDISENNIVIAQTANSSSGILIDLDLAKEQGSPPSGARHRTGTMQFMAIEVLEGISHTYRHDLESFLYIFLWICIRHRRRTGEEPAEPSSLRKWYTGSYKDIAERKGWHMGRRGFRPVLAEFSVYFESLKPLAEKLRGILFPTSAEDELFTGTPPESDCVKMYDRIINAFSEAIENCKRE